MRTDGYRQDIRTIHEFAADLKTWHEREREAASIFEQMLTKIYKRPIRIVENGCDMDGNLLSDHEVSTAPDYKIVTDTGESRLLEIKATKNDATFFHMKVPQIKQYMRRYPNCLILMVNRFYPSSPNPVFTLFTPSIFKNLPFEIVRCHWWGGKLGYRCHVNMFHWEPFVVQDSYPDDYLKRIWVKADAVRAYKRQKQTFSLSR